MIRSDPKKLGPKLADGRTAEVFAWGENQVLKLYREGWTRRTAEYEHRLAKASEQTGYRVPHVREIVEVDGRAGIVYQRIEGETMLGRFLKQPYRLVGFSRQMADLHVEMHAKDAQNLEPVTERLAGKIDAVEALDHATKQLIFEHLFSLPQDTKLLHGDFHPDNIMLTADGPVIIDWIDATLGHPLADAARTAVLARFGVPPEEKVGRLMFQTMGRIYLRRYFRHSPYTRRDLQNWLLPVAAGRLSERIPHEAEPVLAFVKELVSKRR